MCDLGRDDAAVRVLKSDGDFARFGNQACDWLIGGVGAVVQEPTGSADGGVSCKGDFTFDCEDVDGAVGGSGLGDGVNEDGLGEVEFDREEMFLALGEGVLRVGGEKDYGQRIALEGFCGEDIESEELQLDHGG